MKYIFNFENREKPIRFNREKLLLSALQKPEQLYYMMDTQYEGIYQAEAMERRRYYGNNSFQTIEKQSHFRLLEDRKEQICKALSTLSAQKTSVFRKGFHFYSEVDSEELVPGDVVFISRGDIVPSDLRIVFSKDLEVDQSIYTGNWQISRKKSSYNEEQLRPIDITDIPNLCFVGSTVVSGLARGVVISTGSATYLSHLLCM